VLVQGPRSELRRRSASSSLATTACCMPDSGLASGCTVSQMTASTPESASAAPEDRPYKVHLGWVIFLGVLGVAITALAFWGPFQTRWLGENAVSVWQSILTNLGIGLFSAALLLLLEPRIRNAVKQTVTAATKNLKTEVLSAVQVDVEEKLAPLSERIDDLYASRLAEQSAAIDHISQDFTHERVFEALQKASMVSALWQDSVVVQAADEPGDLHIGIELRVPDEDRRQVGGNTWRQTYRVAEASSESKKLHLRAVTGPQQSVEVIWEPTEDFESVAGKIADELAVKRFRALHEKIDWTPVLRRFERAIKVAVDSSNKAPDALNLQGPLVEVAGSDAAPWYLTDDALHYPSKGWFRTKEAIGGWVIAPMIATRPENEVEMPDGADLKEWKYILGRARDHFSHLYS
jgi:predicted phage tail protein